MRVHLCPYRSFGTNLSPLMDCISLGIFHLFIFFFPNFIHSRLECLWWMLHGLVNLSNFIFLMGQREAWYVSSCSNVHKMIFFQFTKGKLAVVYLNFFRWSWFEIMLRRFKCCPEKLYCQLSVENIEVRNNCCMPYSFIEIFRVLSTI